MISSYSRKFENELKTLVFSKIITLKRDTILCSYNLLGFDGMDEDLDAVAFDSLVTSLIIDYCCLNLSFQKMSLNFPVGPFVGSEEDNVAFLHVGEAKVVHFYCYLYNGVDNEYFYFVIKMFYSHRVFSRMSLSRFSPPLVSLFSLLSRSIRSALSLSIRSFRSLSIYKIKSLYYFFLIHFITICKYLIETELYVIFFYIYLSISER